MWLSCVSGCKRSVRSSLSQQKQAVSTGINVEAPFKGECCCRWQRVAVLCEWPQSLGQLFSEIGLAVSEDLEGMKVLNIKPRLPSFEMPGSFTIHVLAQLDLRTYWKETTACKADTVSEIDIFVSSTGHFIIILLSVRHYGIVRRVRSWISRQRHRFD